MSDNTKIGIVGGGRIGKAIYHLLIDGNICQDVYVADIRSERPEDIKQEHYVQISNSFNEFVQGKTLIINALPYTENIKLFRACYNFKVPYFDLSEDDQLDNMLKEQHNHLDLPFIMPHCGLAPGMSTVIAQGLVDAEGEDVIKDIKIRVGALSNNASNKLRYHSSWSGDGLVNEYTGDCNVIHEGKLRAEKALTGYERITIDGAEYEAFNTSGGIGTYAHTLSSGKAINANYKTLRRIGHHDYVDFLFNDLELSKDTLKDIFKNNIPTTTKDCVLLYVQVDGEEYYKKFMPEVIQGRKYTAIEMTTAIGLISMVELFLKGKLATSNYYRQEWVDWSDISRTTYGWYYLQKSAPIQSEDWDNWE